MNKQRRGGCDRRLVAAWDVWRNLAHMADLCGMARFVDAVRPRRRAGRLDVEWAARALEAEIYAEDDRNRMGRQQR